MTTCTNCGATMQPGVKFCSHCGTPLSAAATTAPPVESWRTDADFDVSTKERSTGSFNDATNPYSSPAVPPIYSPPTNQYSQPNYNANYAGRPRSEVHPIVPALVSFFFPGIGLLFVPGKVIPALIIFGGYLALNVALFLFTIITLGLGSCLFLFVPLINVLAAVHSYDESAKASGGQHTPLMFKN